MIFKIKNMCIYIKTHIMSTTTKVITKKIPCACGGRYSKDSRTNHKRTKRHKNFLEFGTVFSVGGNPTWNNTPSSELNPEQLKQKREYQKNYYEQHKSSRKKKRSNPSIINLITKLVNIIENNPDIKIQEL